MKNVCTGGYCKYGKYIVSKCVSCTGYLSHSHDFFEVFVAKVLKWRDVTQLEGKCGLLTVTSFTVSVSRELEDRICTACI